MIITTNFRVLLERRAQDPENVDEYCSDCGDEVLTVTINHSTEPETFDISFSAGCTAESDDDFELCKDHAIEILNEAVIMWDEIYKKSTIKEVKKIRKIINRNF